MDLKCLLAYSSIENVGLILIGIKLGPPESINQPYPLLQQLVWLRQSFMLSNHGLFKSLLFLGRRHRRLPAFPYARPGADGRPGQEDARYHAVLSS